MCKNDYKKHNCKHHHYKSQSCQLDNDIECAIVENGAKEHLKEYENKKKGKFDYRKYIRKKGGCSKEDKNVPFDLCKLNFVPSGYGNQIATVHLDNGYDIRIVLGKDGLIEDIDLSYNYRELGKRLSVFQVFPGLVEKKRMLLSSVDATIAEYAIEYSRQLPGEGQEAFLDKIYNG